MKKNTTDSSTFTVRWRKWIHNALEQMAEILDTCEWFPCPRQTKLPPSDSVKSKTN